MKMSRRLSFGHAKILEIDWIRQLAIERIRDRDVSCLTNLFAVVVVKLMVIMAFIGIKVEGAQHVALAFSLKGTLEITIT